MRLKNNFYFIFIIFFFLTGCKKEKDKITDSSSESMIIFSSIRSFPPSKIEIDFKLDCTKIDTNVYSINWISPSDAMGCLPYKFIIENDYQITYQISNKYTGNSKISTLNIIVDSIRGKSKYDYRNKYIGNYLIQIYSYKYKLGSDPLFVEEYDTIVKNCSIEFFQGYLAGTDSNYNDIEYKIGIKYSDYSLEHDNSRCAWVNYYTEGYLHPRVNLDGEISYEELESCENGKATGYFRNDSLSIKYFWSGRWDGFSREIIGIKVRN